MATEKTPLASSQESQIHSDPLAYKSYDPYQDSNYDDATAWAIAHSYGRGYDFIKYATDVYNRYHDTDRWSQIEQLPGFQPVREQNGWESFLKFFGLGDPYGKYLDEVNQGLYSDVSQIQSNIFENNYNSPSAQASRMRNAGQNPDLLGTNGVSGASEFTEPERSFTPSPDGFESVLGIASTINQTFSAAFAIASQIQDFKLKGLEMDMKGLDKDSKEADLLERLLGVSDSLYSRGDSESGHFDDSLDELFLGFSSSTRKKIKRIYDQLSLSLHGDTLSTNNEKNNIDSYIGLGESQGLVDSYHNDFHRSRNPKHVNTFGNKPDAGVIADISSAQYSLARLAQNMKYNSSISHDRYDNRYYNELDPSAIAGGVNNEAAYKRDYYSFFKGSPSAQFDDRMKSYQLRAEAITNKLLSSMETKALAGDPLAQAFIFMYSSKQLGVAPNFSGLIGKIF